MKLIRHLLSHILLFAFIIVLVLAYFYRTVVFSEQTNTHITRYISHPIQSALAYAGLSTKPVKTEKNIVITKEGSLAKDCDGEKITDITVKEAVVVANESTSTELVVIEETVLTEQDVNIEDITEPTDTTDTALEVTESEVIESEVIESEVIESEVIESEVIESEVAESEVTESEVTESEVIESEVIESEVAESEVAESEVIESEVIESEVTESEAAESTQENVQTSEKSHFGLINQARLAYQAGKSDEAISHYLELIESYPEDPNAHGELGNVYYSKGLWKQASKAYYHAAIQLLKLENRDQLHHLHRVIRGLDPDTAKELLSKLED